MAEWNTTIPARILRVNHGGETGAIVIYRSQILISRLRAPDLLPFLDEALVHECDHQARFRALMPARVSKPCRLMWIWSVGGGVLGCLSALLGREAVLACTAAVERTVHRHLEDQLAWSANHDPELHDTIRLIQADELAHLDFAVQQRRGQGLAWLDAAISGLTEALIWISTRGDSHRLAAQISGPKAASKG